MSLAAPSGAVEIDPVRAAESNTATLLAVLTVFHAIALVFVCLRIYARAFVIKTFGKDDVFMVLSAVCSRPRPPRDDRMLTTAKQLCSIGGWAVFVFQAQHGLGKHQETISSEDMMVFQHAGFWQSIISATWALGFLKISIGFNLLRLSSSKWFKWSLWATIGIFHQRSLQCRTQDLTPVASDRLLLYVYGHDDLSTVLLAHGRLLEPGRPSQVLRY